MPVVKTYQRQIAPTAAPAVQRGEYRIAQLETPAPRPTPSPEALGAGFGKALGAAAEQLFTEQQHKDDSIRLLDADKQTGDLENALTYDQKSGFLNIKGKDAFGLVDSVGSAWDDGVGKIRQGLANDRQRMAYDQHTQAVHQRLMDNVNRHVAGETYRVDGESLEGKTENETQAAIEAGGVGQIDRVSQSIESVQQAYADYGKRWGISPEQTKAATDKAVSRIHQAVLGRMLDNGNDIQAKVYYEHAEGEVLPDQRGPIERALQEGNKRGVSQRLADTIVSKAGTDYTLNGLLEQVPKMTSDPNVRDATEERVRKWYAAQKEDDRYATEKRNETIRQQLEAEKERKEQEKAARDRMVGVTVPNLIDQARPKDVHTFLDKTSPGLWASATQKEREEWERYAKRLDEGGTVKTDFATYYNLLGLSSSPATRDDFAKVNLADPHLLNRISEPDLKKLADVQAAIRKGDDKKADGLTEGYRTVNEMIGDSLRTLKLDPTPKPGTDDDKRLGTLRRSIDDDIADFEERHQKKPTKKEIQGMIDNRLISGTTTEPGMLWGVNPVSAFSVDVPKGQAFSLQINQVPADERSKIERQLQSANVPVTDQNIVGVYLATTRKQPFVPAPSKTASPAAPQATPKGPSLNGLSIRLNMQDLLDPHVTKSFDELLKDKETEEFRQSIKTWRK